MKTLLAGLMCVLCASTASAQADQVVSWRSIEGVITSQNVDNPVADIHSGTFAWTVRSGHARVNLQTGAAAFGVQGLVINGSPFSGTPGPIASVTGTLVCDAGEVNESVFDTPDVPLSATGEANFSGNIGPIPSPCGNPLFLVRIATPEGARGLWIATGAGRTSGND